MTDTDAMPLILEHVTSPSNDARILIAELDAELGSAYAPEQCHGLSLDRVFRPGIWFFIAKLNGEPVGCGGIVVEDGLAQVKRMYVRPLARGRGVAKAILVRLEDEARSRGINRIVLETGDAQNAAIRFYEREGFVRCAAFGSYAVMPPQATERSVFFEKTID